MKVRSIVSCIMLSILVILLFSTAVQATVYREVESEKILEQIKNGEDVIIKDRYVSGKLNLNKITLETVPNPYYYKLLNKGYDKQTLIFGGLNENSSVIESNITIENSIFENRVDFSNVLFNNSVKFCNVKFNDPVDFSGTIFNNFACFSETNFNDSAYFTYTEFNNFVVFSNTSFNHAQFFKTNFNDNFVVFSNTSFNYADFPGTNFNYIVLFYNTSFNHADFSKTNFSVVEFVNTSFNHSVYFSGTNFSNSVKFSGTSFNNSVHFFRTNCNESIDFSGTNFNESVYFNSTDFYDYVNFTGTKFYDSVYFSEMKFYDSTIFKELDTSNTVVTDGKTCESFRNYYKNEAQYVDADNIYYNYRRYSQEQKNLWSLSKLIDYLSWITCGYGLKLSYTLICILIIIGFFTLFYWGFPRIARLSDATEKRTQVSRLDALLFSIRGFTTLGSADWYPGENIFRILVTLEGLFGWIMLGIFMATLTNLLMKS